MTDVHTLIDRVQAVWDRNFSGDPVFVRSPGRINLIGEHTDYNEGYVLPAAIDRHIVAGFGATGSPGCRIISPDTGREVEFSLSDPFFRFPHGSWENYVIGVAAELQHAGYPVGGFKMVFSGDIPMGAGLSSSAALENAVVMGLDRLFGFGLTRDEMIRIARRAEQHYAGVECGIMDQYASMFGQNGQVMLLDCRSVRSAPHRLDLPGYELLLLNSNVRHSLAGTSYNERKTECETGMEILRDFYPEAKSLRDISHPQLEAAVDRMPPVIYDRCSYVIRENRRVLEVVLALEEGDIGHIGEILLEAHQDMRYLYEITCPEVNYLVDTLSPDPLVAGCRMMGGGFGGCTINLVREGEAGELLGKGFFETYEKRYGRECTLLRVETADGTAVIG